MTAATTAEDGTGTDDSSAIGPGGEGKTGPPTGQNRSTAARPRQRRAPRHGTAAWQLMRAKQQQQRNDVSRRRRSARWIGAVTGTEQRRKDAADMPSSRGAAAAVAVEVGAVRDARSPDDRSNAFGAQRPGLRPHLRRLVYDADVYATSARKRFAVVFRSATIR